MTVINRGGRYEAPAGDFEEKSGVFTGVVSLAAATVCQERAIDGE